MNLGRFFVVASVVVWLATGILAQASGPLVRQPNTTLASLPSAPPAQGYTFTNAFPGLTFINPVCLATPPNETNRLFILEKRGRIVVITNLAAPTRSIFLDMTDRVSVGSDPNSVSDEEGLLGLAFHPGYATNGYFYTFYTPNTTTPAGSGRHNVLARYQVSAENDNQADPASHVALLQQPDNYSNHNAGDLHFGPDGYLYVSLGDEGSADDEGQNSQKITKDFFSGILRLDVDKRPGSLPPSNHPATTTNYAVPPDNPFVGATSFNGLPINPATVRTEFWAVGLRNPWRMSFDTLTGILYCGDVGQESREEINIIEPGGNYGWAYWEGNLRRVNQSQIPAGFVHAPPLIDYSGLGFAVVGGRVYRGTRISQLYGAYIYGDHGTGRIWALRHSGTNVIQNQQLFADAGLSAFGADPSNGDILYCDVQNGTDALIKRIIYNNNVTGPPIPPLLSDTGVFTNLTTLEVAPGIVAYDINVPFWSDHAEKQRWFSVPNTNLDLTFAPTGNWSFPTGTVWIKHFELEITNGVPESRRRLETRLLVANANGGYGITYRWHQPPTNAWLVAEAGEDEVITLYDQNGGVSGTQLWNYPGRAECLVCHTPAGGFALGFNTAQLNRDFDYAGSITNQLEALSLASYFSNAITNRHLLPALARADDEAVSLEYRVRSYLAANCAQCHQPAGLAQSLWDARIQTPGPANGIIDGPLVNNFGDPANCVIAPGSVANSVLFHRIAELDIYHMPPLSTAVVNTQAVALLAAWITNELPQHVTYPDWQLTYFGSTNATDAAQLADPDNDGAKNYLEYLTSTVPTNTLSAWKISIAASNDQVHILIPQPANRAVEVQRSTNLFDPEAWTPLNVAGNAPFFSVTNRTSRLSEPAAAAAPVYYRVRVFEP